jgi:hypothetical protein
MDVPADVREVHPGRKFSWRGHLVAESLFTGYRDIYVESTGPGKSRFRHVEGLSGLRVPPFLLLRGRGLPGHHHLYNRSLRERAEELCFHPELTTHRSSADDSGPPRRLGVVGGNKTYARKAGRAR